MPPSLPEFARSSKGPVLASPELPGAWLQGLRRVEVAAGDMTAGKNHGRQRTTDRNGGESACPRFDHRHSNSENEEKGAFLFANPEKNDICDSQ